MQSKKIKLIRNWPQPKLIKDIQVIIKYTNFHNCFIQGFSKIVTSLISIFKTTGLLKILTPKTVAANINTNIEAIGFLTY